MREAGKKQLIVGLVIAGIGLAISLGSSVSAASSSGGGSYFLLWGVEIVGLIRAFRGYSMMRGAGSVPAAAAPPPSPAALPAMPPQPRAVPTPAQPIEAVTTESASPASPPPPPAQSSMWD